MPHEVVDRVHVIADRQKSPEEITFLRAVGTEFEELPQAAAPELTPLDNNRGGCE